VSCAHVWKSGLWQILLQRFKEWINYTSSCFKGCQENGRVLLGDIRDVFESRGGPAPLYRARHCSSRGLSHKPILDVRKELKQSRNQVPELFFAHPSRRR
jgi:hypothetical protein